MDERHAETDPGRPPTAVNDRRRPARRRRAPWFALAALLLVGAVGGWLLRGPAPAPVPPPVSDSTPDDATSAPDVAAGPALTWAPPELDDPETITLSAREHSPVLDDDRDYVLRLPDEALTVKGGVTVTGGRNVVLIGGEIRLPEDARGNAGRALFLEGQTGTVHIEGLLLSGPGLTEGIDLDQRAGAIVQLQNIRVETVRGSKDGHHADVLQTWAGPRVLRIDRLTGSTGYQGLFLLPRQFGDQPLPAEFELRNIDLAGVEGSEYLLWQGDEDWPISVDNVWVAPRDASAERDRFLWARGEDNRDTWAQVQIGSPPDGPFAPTAGLGYTSPDYLTEPGA